MCKRSKDKFDLKNIILNIIKNYKNSNGKGKNIKFEYSNFTSPVIIEADRNRKNQVITNLISNSIKFINKDGEEEGIIFIGINKRKKENKENKEVVVFGIKDNGIGIDKEIMPRLFTKFISESFQGTGLGLYISKNIVEAHGSRIWAENNKDGNGAYFHLVYHYKNYLFLPNC